MALLDTLIALEEQKKNAGKFRGIRTASGALASPRAPQDSTRTNLFVNSALQEFRRESTANRLARTLGTLGVEQTRSSLPTPEDPASKAKVAFDLLSKGGFNPLDAAQAGGNLTDTLLTAGLDITKGRRLTGGTEIDLQERKNQGLKTLQELENTGGNQSALLQNFGLLGLQGFDKETLEAILALAGIKGTRPKDAGDEKERNETRSLVQRLVDRVNKGR